MNRKHKRTRFSTIDFSVSVGNHKLKPGVYRIRRDTLGGYVGSFVVRMDRTVDFYGAHMEITDENFNPVK